MTLMTQMDACDLAARAQFCQQVIVEAGALALEGFRNGTAAAFSMKGPQDFLTETDAASENFIREAIAARFPADTFFGEEGGGEIGERVWIVDPIDGTANFARSIPHFCISIAFVFNGRTELGAIYNPALNELYFAKRGEGATRNGQAISVSATPSFDRASVELGWSNRVPNATYMATMASLLELGANVRRCGSGALALAYVADGRSDAYVELHMNSWDCLAGLLLVSEAGGEVCPYMEIGSLQGGGPVLASAPAIASGVSASSGIPLSGDCEQDRAAVA